jgi:hypothetical protein
LATVQEQPDFEIDDEVDVPTDVSDFALVGSAP